MGSVHDLAPSFVSKPAEVGGVSYRIRGLSSDDTVCILERAPGFAMLLNGGAPEGGLALDILRAINPIISAGFDIEGEDEKKAQALRLPLQQQMQLVTEIIKRTFPDEKGPFGLIAQAFLELMQLGDLPMTSSTLLSAMFGNSSEQDTPQTQLGG